MLPCEVCYASKSPDIIMLPLGVQVIIVGSNRIFRQLWSAFRNAWSKGSGLGKEKHPVEIPRIEEVDKEGKATASLSLIEKRKFGDVVPQPLHALKNLHGSLFSPTLNNPMRRQRWMHQLPRILELTDFAP